VVGVVGDAGVKQSLICEVSCPTVIGVYVDLVRGPPTKILRLGFFKFFRDSILLGFST
jgi:hypothetical protein